MSQQQYTIPISQASEDARLSWLKESVKDSETFLANQTGFQDFAAGKTIIAGLSNDKIPGSLSKTNVNLQKRLIRDIVATMSNIRPLWGYSTDNTDLDTQTEVLNKLLVSWYKNTFADRGIKGGLQYAAAMGTGYIGPDWNSTFWTRGRGDIVIKSYSPENILPVQVPADGDLQRAYAVTIREEVPINLARATFPTMANKIVPDRSSPSGLKAGVGKMKSFLSPVLNRFASPQSHKKAADSVFPVVDIYQTYILDLSINEGPSPVTLGEPGTYWCYTVPVMGSQIPDGFDEFGAKKFRIATAEDAMLYPFRRLITWCNSTILRDGPSYWWHAMVPLVPIYFDKWVWDFLGYSMTRDLDPLEKSSNTLRRAQDDSANARMRPALMHDDRTISKSLMETLDTRQPGKSVGVDFTITEAPIRPILPAAYYDVPQWIRDVISGNDEMMKYLAGVNDFTALAKAKQIPASDTVEKIFEMAGPMVTDISRNMESSLGRLGEMIKCMFFEFYTASRRLQRLGEKGLVPEDAEFFEPGKLIPSHLPGENRNLPSNHSMVERARRYMNSFFFEITPNSLHQITQLSRKLLFIQLSKIGFPIDPWTMADMNDIPNFGAPPAGANTMFEKWVAFKKIEGELNAHIQAKQQEILAREQIKMMMLMGQLQSGGAPGGPAGPADEPVDVTKQSPGRPPSFQGTPTLQQKDGGIRSTITST